MTHLRSLLPGFQCCFPIITLALLALSCANAAPQYSNVSYLPQNRTEKMDIYLPDDSVQRPVPAVLLIHGGGWRVGDKASARERNIAKTLTQAGYAVFSINYLLNERDENKRMTLLAWPQNVIDCKTALRFIRAHAEEYGVDADKIAVMGGSAGGHLSMMVAATANDDEWNDRGGYLDQPNSVSCVVNLYGPGDVRGRAVSPFLGSESSVIAKHEEEASPVVYFDEDLPPMLILQGTGDHTVPVEQTRELVQHLQDLGADYCYVEVAGAPHSFDLQPEQMDLRPVVLAFLHQYLANAN